jgi:hypothetical protein
MLALVYSFADHHSLGAVPQWVEKVKVISPTVQVVHIENEVDLLDGGRVELGETQRMATQLDAPLFRSSGGEGLNVRNLFMCCATSLQGTFLKCDSSVAMESDASL